MQTAGYAIEARYGVSLGTALARLGDRPIAPKIASDNRHWTSECRALF